jgi:hypothetical protein
MYERMKIDTFIMTHGTNEKYNLSNTSFMITIGGHTNHIHPIKQMYILIYWHFESTYLSLK